MDDDLIPIGLRGGPADGLALWIGDDTVELGFPALEEVFDARRRRLEVAAKRYYRYSPGPLVGGWLREWTCVEEPLDEGAPADAALDDDGAEPSSN